VNLSTVLELLLETSLLLGVPPLTDLPSVEIVSKERMLEVCGVKAKGCYLRPIIYIRDDMSEIETKGVLVHELVHHHQAMLGSYASAPKCIGYHLREQEAYFIQNQWLRERGIGAFQIYIKPKCND